MFDRYFRQSSSPVQRFISWIMRRPDMVIALWNRWKRFLPEEVRRDISVQVMPKTVDSVFAQMIDKPGEKPDRDENLALFVGWFGHCGGVSDILKAVPVVVERLPRVRFVLAGTEDRRGDCSLVTNQAYPWDVITPQIEQSFLDAVSQ